MILLDTNVISEFLKEVPNPDVEAWLTDQPFEQLFLTAITEAELRFGATLLPPGTRQNRLLASIEGLLVHEYSGRVLPFDSAAAIAYAQIATNRKRAGRPISEFDAQIAAIALTYGAPIATRNVADFMGCGIDIINPWESPDATA